MLHMAPFYKVTLTHISVITSSNVHYVTSPHLTITYLTPADYKFVNLRRKSHRGSGVGFVFRSSFKLIVNRRDDMKSFELMDVDVSSSGNSMKLVIINRPLPS